MFLKKINKHTKKCFKYPGFNSNIRPTHYFHARSNYLDLKSILKPSKQQIKIEQL